jgi:hypothetical protein
MPRTTLDIDAPILRDLKKRQRREGKSLGRLVSDLLARAMDASESKETDAPFTWNSRPMGARVDIADKEAVRAALDRP